MPVLFAIPQFKKRHAKFALKGHKDKFPILFYVYVEVRKEGARGGRLLSIRSAISVLFRRLVGCPDSPSPRFHITLFPSVPFQRYTLLLLPSVRTYVTLRTFDATHFPPMHLLLPLLPPFQTVVEVGEEVVGGCGERERRERRGEKEGEKRESLLFNPAGLSTTVLRPTVRCKARE